MCQRVHGCPVSMVYQNGVHGTWISPSPNGYGISFHRRNLLRRNGHRIGQGVWRSTTGISFHFRKNQRRRHLLQISLRRNLIWRWSLYLQGTSSRRLCAIWMNGAHCRLQRRIRLPRRRRFPSHNLLVALKLRLPLVHSQR